MRSIVMGAGVGVLLTLLATTWLRPQEGTAQQFQAAKLPPGADALVVLPTANATGDGPHQLAVLDPQMRVLSIYHIDRGSGVIQLKSVRQLKWDLLMQEYNSGSPAPRDIQRMLGPGSPYTNTP